MKRLKVTLIILTIIVLLGFGSKFYQGICADLVNNSFSGVFYEIFWCFIVFLIFRKISPSAIAIIIFITTSILEFLQLWKTPFLEIIRSNFIGRTLIGTSFVWTDFLYYLIGCIISVFLMRWVLCKISGSGSTIKNLL
ncbi:MAG: DUF2809 domain-containing protein [Candidatus Cloacimonetes bacterium]|nr:DUF2809 domain-containing protein [Candidatus Cloacimonadota bacterium]